MIDEGGLGQALREKEERSAQLGPLTPASPKVAMPLWQAAAAFSTARASVAPEPSPSRMPRSKSGRWPICSTSRRWPGSAETCPTTQWSSAWGSAAYSTAAAAVDAKPSSTTGTRPSRAAMTAPVMAASSSPPNRRSMSNGSRAAGRWRAIASSTARRFAAKAAPATPVPGLYRHHPIGHCFAAFCLAHRRLDDDVAGRRVEVHLVDLEPDIKGTAELVDRSTACDEVLHHLRRNRRRVG